MINEIMIIVLVWSGKVLVIIYKGPKFYMIKVTSIYGKKNSTN